MRFYQRSLLLLTLFCLILTGCAKWNSPIQIIKKSHMDQELSELSNNPTQSQVLSAFIHLLEKTAESLDYELLHLQQIKSSVPLSTKTSQIVNQTDTYQSADFYLLQGQSLWEIFNPYHEETTSIYPYGHPEEATETSSSNQIYDLSFLEYTEEGLYGFNATSQKNQTNQYTCGYIMPPAESKLSNLPLIKRKAHLKESVIDSLLPIFGQLLPLSPYENPGLFGYQIIKKEKGYDLLITAKNTDYYDEMVYRYGGDLPSKASAIFAAKNVRTQKAEVLVSINEVGIIESSKTLWQGAGEIEGKLVTFSTEIEDTFPSFSKDLIYTQVQTLFKRIKENDLLQGQSFTFDFILP